MLGEGGESRFDTNINFLLEEYGIMVNNGECYLTTFYLLVCRRVCRMYVWSLGTTGWSVPRGPMGVGDNGVECASWTYGGWGQWGGVGSLLPPCGFQGSASGFQAWWQAPLLTEPSSVR